MYETFEDNQTENTKPQTCVFCGITVPEGNAIRRVRTVYWHDWDDPDEDAQGQYKSRQHIEWYCCGFDEGFGTTDCEARVARLHALDAEIGQILADNERYARYDDTSPGHGG